MSTRKFSRFQSNLREDAVLGVFFAAASVFIAGVTLAMFL